MTDHPVTESIATALVALSSTLATLTREIHHTQGFSAALEERIKALEAKAATPVITPTLTVLKGREIRDGQW
jgi:hypothetical protein